MIHHELDPTVGGEDFACFANEVPGFYFPTFMADDGSVPHGIRVMSSLLLDYLESRARMTP